ncbi:ornithine cyclodeaminase family protein [Peptostreptococcaceae bacterium AGR-M142]
MIILKKEDIDKVVNIKDIINSCKDALSIYSNNEAINPLRSSIKVDKENGISLFMPSYVEKLDSIGLKIVSVFPNNKELNKEVVPSKMLLMDGKTGDVISLMDGTYLTKLRTGALAGLAIDLLSNKDSKIATLFGTGSQAKKQLEAMIAVRDLKEIRVCSKTYSNAVSFCKRMKMQLDLNCDLIPIKDSKEAIKDSDIINCITSSNKPLFDFEYVKKGAHINSMGSYLPNMREVSSDLILSSSLVYVDTKEGVLNEAGDFIIPFNDKLFDENIVTGEIGDLINNKAKKRENKDEITFFKSVGAGILDLLAAYEIYKKAKELSCGIFIKF